jgi:hypothetical protein
MKEYFAHYGFNESYSVAKSLSARADSDSPDSPNRLAAFVFIAFTYESALNHLFKSWKDYFERLSPEAKLTLLTDKSGLKPDFTKPPFQSFVATIKIRNSLAHHKVEFLEVSEDQLKSPDLWPKPKWKNQMRSMSAGKALSDLDEVVQILENALGVWLPSRFIIMEQVQK